MKIEMNSLNIRSLDETFVQDFLNKIDKPSIKTSKQVLNQLKKLAAIDDIPEGVIVELAEVLNEYFENGSKQEEINATFTGADLQAKLEQYQNVSLRKLATACEISYGWILKCSKEPVPGVPFDPEAVNYDKVASVFAKRGIDLSTIDWESLNEATVKRGAMLPKDMDAFQVGGKVYLREDNTTPFEICYKTETHIVIMKEGSTEPRSWSHATFLMKGPVFEPRTVTEKTEEEV